MFSLAVNYLFSSTSRQSIQEAINSPHMNTIKDSQQYGEGGSKVRPQQLDDLGEKPEPETVSDFDDNREKINQWETERQTLTAHKDGTGDGTSIYLDFSKIYRNRIKRFDENR